MKLRYLLILLFAAAMPHLTAFAQDADSTPLEISPSSGSIFAAKLSPNGEYVAVMTIDAQGETYIDVWSAADPSNSRRLERELVMFEGFLWSPNSQYLAVTGRRSNASGNEYVLSIYNIFDTYYPDRIFRSGGRFFGEFILYENSDIALAYKPVWSADSGIIAVNFSDGIHFYDITDCTIEACNLLYVLEVGYVAGFDWQGDMVMTGDDSAVQLWDVSEVSP